MKTGASPIWGQQVPNRMFSQCSFAKNIKDIIASNIKEMIKKKFKVKYESLFDKDLSTVPESVVKLTWKLINKGKNPWPAGSMFVVKKGGFLADNVALPNVEPGESFVVEVLAKVPKAENVCSGVWEIVVGEKHFGKIRGSVKIEENLKVRTLSSMGFTVEKAIEALQITNGDMDLAISQILRN
jgi:UBA/TS-N domain.